MATMSAMNDHVVESAVAQQEPEHHDERRRAEVGAGDHRDAPDRVEEPPEEQRPEEVATANSTMNIRDLPELDVEEVVQDRPEVERHGVVEERLADEQREAEDRARG